MTKYVSKILLIITFLKCIPLLVLKRFFKLLHLLHIYLIALKLSNTFKTSGHLIITFSLPPSMNTTSS